MLATLPLSNIGYSQRQHPRYEIEAGRGVRLSVDLRPTHRQVRFQLLDLALGGCAIQDPQKLLQAGQRLSIELDLGGPLLMLQATVVYRAGPSRVCVAFVRDAALSAASMTLESFLMQLGTPMEGR